MTTGNTVLAADLNQLVNVLQRAASQTEAGHYFLAGSAYTTGAYVSYYLASLSRNATPASVSIDTADQSTTQLNSPQTGHLTVGGFQIFATSTATTNNCFCGGNYTIQY